MSDDTTPHNRIAVIGAGAIGGLLAAAAHAAGHAVTLCVRTPLPFFEITIDGVPRRLPVRIVADPAAVAPAEWVFLATKVQDTDRAAPWLRRLIGPATTVVAAQNGIGHEERVRPYAGSAPIIPALIYIAVERVGPGRVVYHSGRRVVVPDNDAGHAFARLMQGSRFDIGFDADITTALWRKLLSNVAANPITALTMRRIGVIREPDVADLARALLREAVTVGRAAGADLSERDVEDILALQQSFDPAGGTSMLYDRLAGRPLEHQYLTGAVVRAADRTGTPAPLNRALLTLLEALDRGQRDTPAASTAAP